jgi:hypothetical protein
MNAHETLVTRYLAAWNEADPARRQARIAELWTDDAHYRDPLMEGAGHAALDALMAGVQQQFPGYRFRQRGTADGHHYVVRFAWELGPEGETAPIAGSDVAVLAPDGRIQQVIGFLDRVPVGANEG